MQLMFATEAQDLVEIYTKLCLIGNKYMLQS